MSTPHDVRYRVIRILKLYGRTKLSVADSVLKKFVGNEEELIKRSVENYGPEPPPEPIEERVRRYFRAKKPDREGEVPKLLKKYKGKDKELLVYLASELGDEPDPPTPRNSNQSNDEKALQKARLTRYYAHYAPGKSDAEIDKAVEKYAAAGEFPKMWSQLEKKYGPESAIPNGVQVTQPSQVEQVQRSIPTAPLPVKDDLKASHRSRLKSFYQKYAPEKTMDDVNNAIDRYALAPGGFEQMWTALENKYGPELDYAGSADAGKSVSSEADFDASKDHSWLTTEVLPHLKRLENFYAFYVPEKSKDDIQRTLYRFTKTVGGLNGMWLQLTKKYGPEPATDSEIRIRLKKFFGHYAPDTGEEYINEVIQRFGQNTNDMWSALERRYGPENFDDPHAKPRSIDVLKPSLNVTPLLAPTAAINDEILPLNVRRAEAASKVGSVNHQVISPGPILGSFVSIIRVLIRIAGADFSLYDRAPPGRRANFRESVEEDIGTNIALQQKYVRVTRLIAGPGGMLCEVDIELPSDLNPDQVAGLMREKASNGSFTVATIRDAYRKELGGNPVQLFIEQAFLLSGGSGAPTGTVVNESQKHRVPQGSESPVSRTVQVPRAPLERYIPQQNSPSAAITKSTSSLPKFEAADAWKNLQEPKHTSFLESLWDIPPSHVPHHDAPSPFPHPAQTVNFSQRILPQSTTR
jgi:hypothetical protein